MIGVAIDPADLEVAEEFFELFKTPWEVAVPDKPYRVVLGTDPHVHGVVTERVLLYGVEETSVDRNAGVAVTRASGPARVSWQTSTFLVYTGISTFDTRVRSNGLSASGNRAVDFRSETGGRVVSRIGYDLFREISHLLTTGQPVSEAPTPALELHIAVLRHLLMEHRVPFVEISARPAGHDFACCLTHDVDFFGIKRHVLDRTLAGFVARASLGTVFDLFRGRRSVSEAVRNWWALLSLPFVHLGLAPDFWRPFVDYAQVEAGRRTTFFLVPFKERPGVGPDGRAEASRAVPYQISEVAEQVQDASGAGHELAIHGIDAWRDADIGRAELAELTTVTGQETVGIRMHWLYFDKDSARRLDDAGFDYDSTCGYNEAVGYRAGTSQVFRPPGSRRLMELPLAIMDSALFFKGRMGLGPSQAMGRCRRILDEAKRYGGTLVLNWHGRSLAPERLWGGFYRDLLVEIEAAGRVWFATSREVVRWFRWRRSIRFAEERHSSGAVIVIAAASRWSPGATVQNYRPTQMDEAVVETLSFDGQQELRVGVES